MSKDYVFDYHTLQKLGLGFVWRYVDQFGLVQDNRYQRTTQNGVRFTSEVIVGLILKAGDTYVNFIAQLHAALLRCEKLSGMLWRSPDNPEQEQPDNYVARIHVSALLQDGFALRFLMRGLKTGFVFNNENATVWRADAYLGRQRQLIAHAKWAAGYVPDVLEQVWWAIAVLQGAWRNTQDEKVLSWHLVSVAENKNWFTMIVSVIWRWRLKAHYRAGIGEVLYRYFTDKQQPSIKLLWGEYGRTVTGFKLPVIANGTDQAH